MSFASLGSLVMGWVKQIPAFVWWLVLGLLFFKWVEMSSISRGKSEQRAETKVKQAQVKVAVNERSTEIISEERTHADEAIAARDSSPLHPSSDLVPEHIGRVAFRDHGGGETR
jgi:hypothetical protein